MENVRDVGKYDAAVIGIPFDSGTTYRPGTRFGPQGIRRISALYTPYNYELGVDLREQMTLCDAGDVFTIPANLEKSFDQITKGVSHVASSGALPIMLGGDHSIGFPCVRGIADVTSKRIGIIHFDRHIDIQEKDLDERMHTTPWYWATNLPNVPASNLVQLGIGGWQVPRYGVAEARKRGTNVLTISDIEQMGLEKTAEIALELAWKDADAVYISFDVDSLDCGFVPGTGWPEPGGFLPREALKLLGLVTAPGHLRTGGGRGIAALRHVRHHGAVRRACRRRGARLDGRPRQSRQAQIHHRQAGELLTMHDDHHHGHGHHHDGDDHHHHPHRSGPQRACRQAGAVADPAPAGRPGPAAAGRPGNGRPRSRRNGFPRRLCAGARTRPASCALPAYRSSARAADGARLHLLRVETEDLVDVGAVMPLVGGAGVAYHPLPARLTSHRRRLAFVYHDGTGPKHLGFAAARALKDASASSQFAIPGATTAAARPLTTTEVKP